MMDADNLILTSAILTLASTTAASVLPHCHNPSPADPVCVHGALPSFRMLIGQSLVFTGVGMVSQVGPSFASKFSLLIAFTAVTYYGLPILDEVFNGDGICKVGAKCTPRKVSHS